MAKEINDLTLKATPVSGDELVLQETGGGTTKKTTALAVAQLLQTVGATYLQLIPGTAPAHSPGRIAYDSDIDGFIGYIDDPEVTMNFGEEMWARVRNNTGSTITNGQVVYISGAIGQNPTIALAKADAAATSRTIGVATHDIENNTVGRGTVGGLVRGLNTSGFSDGDMLYLSDSVAGALTATKPTAAGSYKTSIGHVTYAHVSAGVILVNISNGLDYTDMAGVGDIVTTGSLTSDNVNVGSFLNLGAPVELTIAAGEVTATQTYHTIDTEADDASDDLVTINGGSEGDILVIRTTTTTRVVTVKDGTGNILIEGDFVLTNSQDTITLLHNGSFWIETSRANNA